ncbi:MAG: peroxiredoxin [Candidatus Dormiibacterota bacterium]
MPLTAGVEAPLFRLEDQDGNTYALAELSGRKVLLYFYPKDDTRGCTMEAQQFNELLRRFEDGGIVVLGVSADDARSHQRFRAKYGLRFPLLCDTGAEVAKAYDAYGERHSFGKTVVGVKRSTFLIDEGGRIERAWYDVRPDGHPEAVLAEVVAS